MAKPSFIFVSVVICSFNGGNHIDDCLESLSKQTYPKDRYEVIVVDDGSTDNTADKARARGVRVVCHKNNQGLSAARNSGLFAANGEIVAYIDDDCVAEPSWLERLVEPLREEGIAATGGRVLAYKTDYLIERYLYAAEYGNPVPLAFGKSKNPLWRFWVYVTTMFMPMSAATDPVEVQAVFTANVAYRKSALLAIGGFDEGLMFFEDTDLSARLRTEGKHLFFIPGAIVYHRNPNHLGKFIMKTYQRAQGIPRYYAKEKKSLPIFPLPLVYIALVICLFIIQPIVGIVFIFFGPALVYNWWLVRMVRDSEAEYCLYGYIQLVLELAILLGLARESLRSMKFLSMPIQY